MYELLYTSVSPTGLSESELSVLLTQARIKNHELGITGMLIYHNHEFMQILEGEEEKVKALYQTIREDERHTSVEVFYQGEIKQRAFLKWSMAYKLLDNDIVEKALDGYEEFDLQKSPLSMIKESRNHGKEAFLVLRDMI